jgi:hypothetical protein
LRIAWPATGKITAIIWIASAGHRDLSGALPGSLENRGTS